MKKKTKFEVFTSSRHKTEIKLQKQLQFASTLQVFEPRAEAPPTRPHLANQSTASRPHGASVKSSEKRDETSCPHRPGSSAASHQGEPPLCTTPSKIHPKFYWLIFNGLLWKSC